MRISDWSSVVCSSDLPTITAGAEGSDSRASADQAPGVARGDRDGESYSAGVNASWELDLFGRIRRGVERSEEHTSELQSLMRISYAVFCLKKKNNKPQKNQTPVQTSRNAYTNRRQLQN